MFRISPDNPAYYVTSVAKDRLPIFRTDRIKTITCNAIDEARRSGGFLVLAYVVMPDHMHLVTSSALGVSETLRYINGISGHRIISHLKEAGQESSLRKLLREGDARGHKYSLWDHHPNARQLTNEASLMQRVNYTHLNPVRLGLVERPEDYRWSRAKQWRGCPVEDEPLIVDIRRLIGEKQSNSGGAAGRMEKGDGIGAGPVSQRLTARQAAEPRGDHRGNWRSSRCREKRKCD